MIAILLFGLVAATLAAPHRHHHHGPLHGEHRQHFHHYDPFSDDIFDTKQFWTQMANEMREINELLATFSQRFPTLVSQNGIEGNEYKITIPLNGYEEKDIVVKAKEGFLMVQAVHKFPEGGQSTYLDAKTLPAYVNVTGTWTFSQGVLKIVFPLKTDAITTTEVDKVDVTEAPVIKDREEIDNNSASDNGDADVGLQGDLDKTNAMLKNKIPGSSRVEATRHAVDLKDEVEFVPVRKH